MIDRGHVEGRLIAIIPHGRIRTVQQQQLDNVRFPRTRRKVEGRHVLAAPRIHVNNVMIQQKCHQMAIAPTRGLVQKRIVNLHVVFHE